MPSEVTFKARDRKAGMTLLELEEALSTTSPSKRYRLKARVGFGGQVQELTFVEDRDEA